MHGVPCDFQPASPGGEGDILRNRKVTWALDGGVLFPPSDLHFTRITLAGAYVSGGGGGHGNRVLSDHCCCSGMRGGGLGQVRATEVGKSGQIPDIL